MVHFEAVPAVPAFRDVESIALTSIKRATAPRTGLNDVSNTLYCIPVLKTQIDGAGETLDGGGDVGMVAVHPIALVTR